MSAWSGQRQKLRQKLRLQTNYEDWKAAAVELDVHLGNRRWNKTVTKVKEQLREVRLLARSRGNGSSSREADVKLRNLVEACLKNNFVGVENPRLYSETYCGTKRLTQEFVDELYNFLAHSLYSPLTQPGREICRSQAPSSQSR